VAVSIKSYLILVKKYYLSFVWLIYVLDMSVICAINNIQHKKPKKEAIMSVYVVNEIVGTSAKSWEDAAKQAVETAVKTVKDLRIGEVVK